MQLAAELFISFILSQVSTGNFRLEMTSWNLLEWSNILYQRYVDICQHLPEEIDFEPADIWHEIYAGN